MVVEEGPFRWRPIPAVTGGERSGDSLASAGFGFGSRGHVGDRHGRVEEVAVEVVLKDFAQPELSEGIDGDVHAPTA